MNATDRDTVEPDTPFDTAREAEALQREIHRRMTGAERLRAALELSEVTHRLARAGRLLRNGEPDPAD